MSFSQVLDSLSERGGEWTAAVPDTWLQGRSLFGGLQAALAVRAMRQLVPSTLPLRVLQVTFAAPVPAGTLRGEARVLRTGKSVTHAEAKLLDDANATALVVGVFGASRVSRVRVDPARTPVPESDSLPLPFVQGLSPNFTQHFSMRWIEGGLPFTGSTVPKAVLEVGINDGSATMTEEHLVAIADAPPPVALSLLDARAVGSSLTWTLEVLTDGIEQLPLSGYRLDAEVVAARDGYTSQTVMVWAPDGSPAALSRQSMVVFG